MKSDHPKCQKQKSESNFNFHFIEKIGFFRPSGTRGSFSEVWIIGAKSRFVVYLLHTNRIKFPKSANILTDTLFVCVFIFSLRILLILFLNDYNGETEKHTWTFDNKPNHHNNVICVHVHCMCVDRGLCKYLWTHNQKEKLEYFSRPVRSAVKWSYLLFCVHMCMCVRVFFSPQYGFILTGTGELLSWINREIAVCIKTTRIT